MWTFGSAQSPGKAGGNQPVQVVLGSVVGSVRHRGSVGFGHDAREQEQVPPPTVPIRTAWYPALPNTGGAFTFGG